MANSSGADPRKIKGNVLFEEDAPRFVDGSSETASSQSFEDYLRSTPAAPLSTAVRAILWSTGVIVVALLFATLIHVSHARRRHVNPPPADVDSAIKSSLRSDDRPSLVRFRIQPSATTTAIATAG